MGGAGTIARQNRTTYAGRRRLHRGDRSAVRADDCNRQRSGLQASRTQSFQSIQRAWLAFVGFGEKRADGEIRRRLARTAGLAFGTDVDHLVVAAGTLAD